jgi:hypothetical protein
MDAAVPPEVGKDARGVGLEFRGKVRLASGSDGGGLVKKSTGSGSDSGLVLD